MSTKRSSHRHKHADRLTPERFREAVWILDGGKDRATGQVLERVSDDWDRRGEVAHLKPRRVEPSWATDPKRAILLSMKNHMLSDARGNGRLKILDAETGEPATDASRPIRFTLYDKHGGILWTRVSERE